MCVSKLTTIGSGNGLSPRRRQAIIWTNAGILLIRPLRSKFSEILIKVHMFLFKKMNLNISSAEWRPFCLGLNVLKRHFEWKNFHMTPKIVSDESARKGFRKWVLFIIFVHRNLHVCIDVYIYIYIHVHMFCSWNNLDESYLIHWGRMTHLRFATVVTIRLVIACRLFCARPLPEPVVAFYQRQSHEYISVTF